MEVAKQPSPWPCVVMLAALLACCLAAPRYWQRGTTSDSADEFANDLFFMGSDYEWPVTHRTATSGSLLSLGDGQPTILAQGQGTISLPEAAIDELIASRSASNPFDAMGRRVSDPLFIGPAYLQPIFLDTPQSTATVQFAPDPAVASVFERIGSAVANFMPANAVPVVVSRIADAVPTYFASSPDITPVATAR
jgi:hypothetical protein